MILIHLAILCITVVGIILADKYALSWVRGVNQVLDAKRLKKYHYWVGVGLIGMIITGVVMYSGKTDELNVSNLAFVGKMCFVGLLVINSFVIGALTRVATVRTYASLTLKEKMPLMISGIVSAVGWVGAITLAFFIG